MLVLSRKVGERIWIGNDISVTVVKITGGGVRIGIEAPHELPVVREELKLKLEQVATESASQPEAEESADEPQTLKFPTRESI